MYPACILHIITEIGYCGVDYSTYSPPVLEGKNDTKPEHVPVSSFLGDSDPYVYVISDLKATYNTV